MGKWNTVVLCSIMTHGDMISCKTAQAVFHLGTFENTEWRQVTHFDVSVQTAQSSENLFKAVQSRSKPCKAVQSRSKSCKTVQSRQKPCKVVESRSKPCKAVNEVQICSKPFNSVQNRAKQCSIWLHLKTHSGESQTISL